MAEVSMDWNQWTAEERRRERQQRCVARARQTELAVLDEIARRSHANNLTPRPTVTNDDIGECPPPNERTGLKLEAPTGSLAVRSNLDLTPPRERS
jgi:hypothetical protein